MVHVDKCIKLLFSQFSTILGFINETNETEIDIQTCTKQWLLKSSTSFYGYDNFSLPWYFGLFCFNFSIGGIVMLMLKPKWVEESMFPYETFAYLLIFIQGELN